MLDFEEALQLVATQSVLRVGDLILDDFVYGEVSRISPEAPVPVLTVTRHEIAVGGAGNVARNAATLGAQCIFVGVIGEDEGSRTLMRALGAETMIEPHLVVDAARSTTRKVRFVSEHYSTHLLRADWELSTPINANTEKLVIERAIAALPRAGCLVLSDYAKGALTPKVIRSLIDEARRIGKPVIVDPKGKDFSIYHGATIITPNRAELAAATRMTAVTAAEVNRWSHEARMA